jgi:hypothetical protein
MYLFVALITALFCGVFGFSTFVHGKASSAPIKCNVTVGGTAQYLHERMCDANEWKDCQPWVREEPTIKERYLNLAKDVCK